MDKQCNSSSLSVEPRDSEVNDFNGFVQVDIGFLSKGRNRSSNETSTRVSQQPNGTRVEVISSIDRMDVRTSFIPVNMGQVCSQRPSLIPVSRGQVCPQRSKRLRPVLIPGLTSS